MIVYVECPPGWAARQMLIGQLEALGYPTQTVGIGDLWRLYLT